MTSKRMKGIKKSNGFALIAVIFFIVIVTAIISLSNNLVSNQIRTTSNILLRTQAYFAANSGLAWIYNYATTTVGCPATNPTVGTVGQFTVSVSCNRSTSTYAEPGQTSFYLYSVTATATSGTYSKTGYIAKTISQTFISRKIS